MKLLLLLPFVALVSCAQLESLGYAIDTPYGTYRDSSINGKADGEIELNIDKTRYEFYGGGLTLGK